MNQDMHQIGEVAEVTGLSLRTIRHYEEVDLVPPSGRTAGGFRLYTRDDIERLHLVKHMKPLEFSLDELRQLLDVRDRLATGEGTTEERSHLVEQLRMFGEIAEHRCERLRGQVASAEAAVQMLRSEVEPVKPRRRAASPRR